VSWPQDLLRGADLVSVELDWKASTARLVFALSAAGGGQRQTITAKGVRRAIFGGTSATLPSASVVQVLEPEPTADGLRILGVEMDDNKEFLLVADEFEIAP
jgi:hypothetical protein